MTLVAGLMIILRSATKITHKAQAITCLATKWHACATVDSFINASDPETPIAQIAHEASFPDYSHHGDSDGDDAGDEEDDVDSTKFLPAYAYSTISFQKRQALGKLKKYLYFLQSFCLV
uniref:Uncharacterized protein n=1 Tax=Opuntia streptacantha TaxID=393608 RepID=A0A7C9AAA1_OPUST